MFILSQLWLASQNQNSKALPYENEPLWLLITASPDNFHDVSAKKSSEVLSWEPFLDWYFPKELLLWRPRENMSLLCPSLRIKEAL